MQHVINADHPSLPGHFPGQPTVPGVVILSVVLDELAAAARPLRVLGVRRVKFVRRLLPGEAFRIELRTVQAGKLAFTCWVDQNLLVEGQALLDG